jgi:hypothetical protein
MGFVNGVNLLPSTGEFTYATTARLGQRVTEAVLTGVHDRRGSLRLVWEFDRRRRVPDLSRDHIRQ